MTDQTDTALAVRAVRAVDGLPIQWQPLAFDLLFLGTELGDRYGYAAREDAARDLILATSA